jgi:hypothetical protein
LRKGKRDKGPLHCRVTGTVHEPKIALQDAPLVVRCGIARCIMRVYAWASRTFLQTCSLRRAAPWASISRSTSFWQSLKSSLTSKMSNSRRRPGPTRLRAFSARPGPNGS